MTTNFKQQMWEAAGWTFLETFLVTIGPTMVTVQIGDWHALLGVAASAAMSAGAAAVSLVKSMIVKNVGAKDSTLITGDAPCEDTATEEVQ